MYTTTSSLSKHTTSLSPNQFLRPQRDHSPSNITRQPNKTKYYSTQQVTRMIKSYIQPRILYLKNQLQQKNRIIQLLNQKLDDNDDKLTKLYNYTENMSRKQKQYQQQMLQKQQNSMVQIVNQLLNDKLKLYWQTVNTQIDRIKSYYKEQIRVDQKQIQYKIQQQLDNIRKQTTQYIDQSRVKNNSYWLKIKQALNRINSKIGKVDEMLVGTMQQYECNQQLIKQQIQHLQQMHNSKHVVKKLIELKKSVQNIYQNYSSLLQLQNIFKNRLDESKVGGVMMARDKDEMVGGGGLFDDDDFGSGRSKRNGRQFGVNSGGNTFPMFKKKPTAVQQQLPMHFKQQQSTYTPLHPTYTTLNQQFNTQSSNYKQSDHLEKHLSTDDNFVLQYSRDENGSDLFGSNQGSAVVIGVKQQQQKASSQGQFNVKYFVPTYTKNKSGNNSLGNPTYELSPIKSTPSQTSKLSHNPHSPTDLSCLNSSLNAHRPGAASRSTSFVNLSLQNRNQMSQSIKQRLQQIIQLKNLPKPLIVYVDEINYLKNNDGNYLFDTRGNMFKVNKEEGKELERMGIVKFVDKRGVLDGSGIKKKEYTNNNNNNNNQLLDKLTIPETISFKSINSITKINSIALSKNQI